MADYYVFNTPIRAYDWVPNDVIAFVDPGGDVVMIVNLAKPELDATP